MENKLWYTSLILLIIINITLLAYNFIYKRVIIRGTSMEPTYYEGNKVNCLKRPKNIVVGDVIGYKQGGRNIIHRVVSITEVDGLVYYTLKGDNNFMTDILPITKENIYCKVVEWI